MTQRSGRPTIRGVNKDEVDKSAPYNHAVVWMDSKQANVFRFSAEDVEKARIRADNPFRKIHHKAGVIGAGHVHLDREFFDHIVEALGRPREWLLLGPGKAKEEFLAYLSQHKEPLRKCVVAVEATEHPTDSELLHHAHDLFRAIDKMQGTAALPQ
jgi:stalled ribosome rescue protein Dom34